MVQKEIYLNSVEKVKEFTRDMETKFPETVVDIVSKDNHYTVDAKSILGIFSLDLSKPVLLTVQTDDIALVEQIAVKYPLS